MYWTHDDIGDFSSKENILLEQICTEHDIPPRLVTKLLDMESQTQGMSRRSSIYSKIDRVLSEEWRTEEEILNDIKQHKGQSKS